MIFIHFLYSQKTLQIVLNWIVHCRKNKMNWRNLKSWRNLQMTMPPSWATCQPWTEQCLTRNRRDLLNPILLSQTLLRPQVSRMKSKLVSSNYWLMSRNRHEIHETCPYVTFCFVKNTHFLIVAESAFYQIRLGRKLQHTIFGNMHFLLISENEFFLK